MMEKKERKIPKLELPGGRYCNIENLECKEYGRVYSDDGGYICANCGGRVSKWNLIMLGYEENDEEKRKENSKT